MKVAVSRLHFPVTTLGPGRRVGLWLQGCTIRCPGCISVDTWDADRSMVAMDSLIESLDDMAPLADGLTVSGGEPFEQPDALAAILTHWRRASPRSAFVFTGREMSDLGPWFAVHPGLIDAVMTGPFRSDWPQTRALRGSDNQDLHVLTALGQEFLAYERPATAEDRKLDLMLEPDGAVFLAGIPARGDLARLRRALRSAGHHAETSDTIANLQ